MDSITYNDLPQAVTNLQETVNDIKRILLQSPNRQIPEHEILLPVQDVAKLLKISVPAVYDLIYKGNLPSNKRSNRYCFYRSDILNYIKAGEKTTISEKEVVKGGGNG